MTATEFKQSDFEYIFFCEGDPSYYVFWIHGETAEYFADKYGLQTENLVVYFLDTDEIYGVGNRTSRGFALTECDNNDEIKLVKSIKPLVARVNE